jgi:hypothetical protein
MGALLARSDALTPMAGSVTPGLYAAGVGGVGLRGQRARPDLDRRWARGPRRDGDAPHRT